MQEERFRVKIIGFKKFLFLKGKCLLFLKVQHRISFSLKIFCLSQSVIFKSDIKIVSII